MQLSNCIEWRNEFVIFNIGCVTCIIGCVTCNIECVTCNIGGVTYSIGQLQRTQMATRFIHGLLLKIVVFGLIAILVSLVLVPNELLNITQVLPMPNVSHTLASMYFRANYGVSVIPKTGHRKMNVKHLHCLAENICLKNVKTNIYTYVRTEKFGRNIESKINYSRMVLNTDDVVPRQVHFIKFHAKGKDLPFETLIAIMAAQRYAKPSRILFWHNNLPSGKYWDEALRRVDNIYLVYLKPPTSIRGRKVAVVQHQADVARLEILLEYGGIYLDTDSILVNPIDALLKYDITMGREVPAGLGNGIIFSKPWSDFMKMWHHNYSTFVDSQWGAHSVLLPHKLHRDHPNLLHLADKDFFRPNWREKPFLYTPGKHWNWTTNYAVHLYNSPKRLPDINPEFVKKWNCTVGEIMRYIYFGNLDLQS